MNTVFGRFRFQADDLPVVTALGLLVAAFTFVAGPLGLLAGLVTVAVWYATSAPSTLAAGHILLAPLFPTGIDPLSFAVVEAAFLALLLASTVRTSYPIQSAGVALVSAFGLAGVAWFLLQYHPLWITAIGVLVVFALASYATHRYELVRLGLVSVDPSPNPTTDT